jgi:hypothetical protein
MKILDVFVSYNQKDRSLAQYLAEELRKNELRPWLDIEQLPPGQLWSPKIKRVIEATPAALFLIGPHGLGPWQQRELRVCQDQRLRGHLLLPVLLPGGQERADLPWILRNLRWFTLTESFPQHEIEDLVSILRDRINSPRKADKESTYASGSSSSQSRAHPFDERAFAFEHLVAHLAQAGDRERLFKLLEGKGFLAEKSDFFGRFQPALHDLNRYVLPATTEPEDWRRFLRYSLVSKNLLGLSATLGTPRVVQLLLDNGQQALAEDITGLSPSECRPQLSAILAADLEEDDPRRSDFIRTIGENIADISKTTDLPSARYRAELLAGVGFYLGLKPLTIYEQLLESIRPWPDLEDSIWVSTAQGYLERGLKWYPFFWGTVRLIRTSTLLSFLPQSVLKAPEPMPPDKVRDDLIFLWSNESNENNENKIFWHTWVAALARKARYDPEGCLSLWKWFPDKRSVPWSPGLLELGRDFFNCFTPDGLDDLCTEMQTEEQAALRVIVLEAAPNLRRAEEAFWTLQGLPWGSKRIHWTLRYLLARPPEPAPRARREALSFLSRLSESPRDLPSSEAALVLALVSRYQPKDLPSRLQALAQGATPLSRVLEIAQSSQSAAVLDAILAHLGYLQRLSVKPPSADASICDEIIKTACLRLCELWGDLNSLDLALPLLNGGPADNFCLQVAHTLAEKGYLRLAREACERIGEPSARLRAMLSVLPPDLVPSDLLTPRKLYEAAASIGSFQQQLTVLAEFVEKGVNSAEIPRRYLVTMNNQRYVSSNTALHSPLGLQRGHFQNPKTGTPLRSASPVIGEIRRKFLTSIALPSTYKGFPRSLGIAGNASTWVHQIVNDLSFPWPVKVHAIEWFLARIASEYLDSRSHPRLGQAFASIIESIARIPIEIENPAIHKATQARWHEIFPILMAFVERYPKEVASHLRNKSFGLKLPRYALWQFFGSVPRFIHRAQAPSDFVSSRWVTYLVDEAHESRSPLPPRQMEVVQLCLGDLETRERKARSLLLQDSPDPTLLRSLAVLLARDRPKLVADIVERLSDKELRDDLAIALIRDNRLPHEHAIHVQSRIVNEATALEAKVWLELRTPRSDAWLKSFASLLGYHGADPSDPSFRSVLERIWKDGPSKIRSEFAEAVLIALNSGDHVRSEAALMFWMHGFLASQRRHDSIPVSELIDCVVDGLSLG